MEKSMKIDFSLGETVYAVINNQVLAGVVIEVTGLLHSSYSPRPYQDYVVDDYKKLETEEVMRYTVDFGEEKRLFYSKDIFHFLTPGKIRYVSELFRDKTECKKAYINFLEKNL